MSQYKTGTATFTNGSATVAGTGTAWLSNVSAGDFIVRRASSSIDTYTTYQIAGVTSDTELTLTAPYGEDTATDVSYVVHVDFFGVGIPKLSNADVETASILNRWITNLVNSNSLPDFGTAVTYDVGTADGELPTNGNLGTAATRDVGTNPNDLVERSEIESRIGKTVTVNFDADANITLTDAQNQYGRIVITDTGGTLTTERQIIVNADERFLTVKNETDYDIKIVTASGTGVHVTYGEQFSLRCDGTNILTNGTSNVVEILSLGTYSSGTVSYPHSLDQLSMYEILTTVSDYLTDLNRGGMVLITSGQQIADYPTSWKSVYQAQIDHKVIVEYDTATSLLISREGNDGVTRITAKLKDGVSY